jgi:hypothetical protein
MARRHQGRQVAAARKPRPRTTGFTDAGLLRLLTDNELSEMQQLKTVKIEVGFDFEAGYQWPEVTLTGTQADE